jgi:hypothetical protein
MRHLEGNFETYCDMTREGQNSEARRRPLLSNGSVTTFPRNEWGIVMKRFRSVQSGYKRRHLRFGSAVWSREEMQFSSVDRIAGRQFWTPAGEGKTWARDADESALIEAVAK